MELKLKRDGILPGFGLTLGITCTYLSLLVLLPLSMVFVKLGEGSAASFWQAASSPRALAAYKLSFGASLLAAFMNLVMGTLVAWVLVRYSFPGKKIFDALIDLPFALPTAVAGISLTMLYSNNGWIGSILSQFGLSVAFSAAGVFVALVFVGLPFVIRTVQPILVDLEPELEEAAAVLGASRLRTFFTVILPAIWPGILTGFSLAFARGLGEYGSVIFISGNMPMRTEIVPLLIMTRLESFDYQGAAALAAVMLVFSFGLMLLINILQHSARGSRS